jgi:Sortase domain
MTRLASRRAVVAVSLTVMGALLARCGGSDHAAPAPASARSAPTPSAPAPSHTLRPRRLPDPPVPASLFAKQLSLRAGPVPVPLRMLIPSIKVDSQVLGVGVTPGDVMDAPGGPVNDPVWQEAFWYRGGAVPGAISTALIAGHIDGPRGTAGVFGHIDQLRPGDRIVVRDTRSGLDVRFAVTGSTSFTLDQASEPGILKKIYGVGPVAGTTPQRSKDGLAHLTLITCSGTFRNGIGTHDHRLVVFATRVA